MTKWKVTCNYVNGKKYYQVYRNVTDKEPDHSGNREYLNKQTYSSQEQAQSIADTLNNQISMFDLGLI